MLHSKKRDTSLFIPIKEEDISPVRPSKISPQNRNGGGAKTNTTARRRHSTAATGADKRPKRPSTPKKTNSPATKGSRRVVRNSSGGRVRSPKSGRSSAGASASTKVAFHSTMGMSGNMGHSRGSLSGDLGFDLTHFHGHAGVGPDTAMASDHYAHEHLMQEITTFSYDYAANDSASGLAPEPERSMSCPVLDIGEFGAPPALYNGDMFMASSTRSSADMSGSEVIGLLTGLEMSNVDEVLSSPSPNHLDNHTGHNEHRGAAHNGVHGDHASHVFDDWNMMVVGNDGP